MTIQDIIAYFLLLPIGGLLLAAMLHNIYEMRKIRAESKIAAAEHKKNMDELNERIRKRREREKLWRLTND